MASGAADGGGMVAMNGPSHVRRPSRELGTPSMLGLACAASRRFDRNHDTRVRRSHRQIAATASRGLRRLWMSLASAFRSD